METKKERVVSSLFTVMCTLLLIGYAITIILRIKFIAEIPAELAFLSTIICMAISVSIGIFYIVKRNKYFVTIRLHVNSKWFMFEYIAIAIFLVNSVMTLLFLLPLKIDSFKLYAPYLCLAVIVILNIIAVGFHEYSAFKIKIDHQKRMLGEESEKEDGKDDCSSKKEQQVDKEDSKIVVNKEATAGKFYE